MKLNDMYKITKSPGEIKEIIKKIITISGFNQSIYLEGASGIGKSEMVIQLAKELDAELIDIRLGNLDTIDLNGIGIPDLKNKKAIWTRPEFFPPENCDKKYLIFLDEFNHASEQVFGAAYQLVLERRMGTHILPKNVLVIGAGNSIDDKGIAFSMPSPLVNRFMKINVEANINDWLKYAEQNNIHWKILGFLKYQPEFLHKFDGTSSEDNFPTPRNWVKLNPFSEYFDDFEFMEVILNSLFGMSVMLQFKEYLKIIKDIPQLEEILVGNLNDFKTLNDLNSSYAFFMLVKNYLKNNKEILTNQNFLNLFKFNNIQPNQEVMQLLNLEIISFINNELPEKQKVELQYLIYEDKNNDMNVNKEYIKKIREFKDSIITK